MKLNNFPLLRVKDLSKKYCVRRVFNCFQALHNQGTDPPEDARLATLTGQICTQMEIRKLCFARNLQKYRAHGMPWLQKVERRIGQMKEEDSQLCGVANERRLR